MGPGRAINTDEWFVVCANVLGGCQGTTGPSSLAHDGRPWGSRFPVVTVADMVVIKGRLADALGINSWALMLGPSLGGMRVLEWLVRYPERVRGALVLGSTAAVTADQIGARATQLAAMRSSPGLSIGRLLRRRSGRGPARRHGPGATHRPPSPTAATRSSTCGSGAIRRRPRTRTTVAASR